MQQKIRIGVCTLVAVALLFAVGAAPSRAADRAQAIEQLRYENRGAEVRVDPVTGTARFVRLQSTGGAAATRHDKQQAAAAFLVQHGAAFGLRNAAAELELRATSTDALGETHLTYAQRYGGLPVFGGFLKAHFDAAGQLKVVNGAVVPGVAVKTFPARDAREAGASALAFVGASDLAVLGSRLLVFREGQVRGVPGADHLAWEIELGNGRDAREFVYVDAHTAKVIDRISGVQDALFRRAYNAMGATAPGPNYPGSPFWVEGDAFPTGTVEADNMIRASKDTYDLYFHAFGRDSFDGVGGIMDSIFNRGNGCPNASWNGIFISFCPGLTTDDVTAHEWSHAYTQYTDNLIYQWQPGALNEASSDIFGETVDLLNGTGGDTPNNLRTAGACTTFTTLPPTVTVNAPAAIAGVKPAGTAAFGPQVFTVSNDVVLANDGVAGPSTSDGCCAGPSFVCAANSWPNAAAVAGKFALVDRGVCGFAVKVKNAQVNGAVGVIVANSVAGIVNMGGADPTIVIPSLSILLTDGNAIKAQFPTTVNATLSRGATGTDNSVRWLMGEDSTAPGLIGALRDMWNPNCYGNPGKVSDARYGCGTGDNGGVHNNSGVDNHAFALLVDGGTYNGHTVNAIGLTKAAHVYFRAKVAYQGPGTDFADHADALEQSCADLVGVDLASLTTGAPSGEVITAADCDQVAEAVAAVEFRLEPTFCGFQPLLAKNPPPLCPAGSFASHLFHDDFDAGSSSTARWAVSHEAVSPADFTERDWVVSADLPDHQPGQAFFGIDPMGGTCAPGGDESGVLHLDSPQIVVPASVSAPMLTFDHWVATEAGWDGGNVKISVNSGPWTLVQAADFVYNPYNATLNPAPANTNPLAGQRAFSGTDGGAVTGSWGRSIVNLAPYVQPKDKFQLRFDFGNDGCTGFFGWYIDDLAVYTCR